MYHCKHKVVSTSLKHYWYMQQVDTVFSFGLDVENCFEMTTLTLVTYFLYSMSHVLLCTFEENKLLLVTVGQVKFSVDLFVDCFLTDSVFRDSLDLAFKYFTSSTLTVRLAGLSQIAVSHQAVLIICLSVIMLCL